jgi:hypothetical protein
LKKTFSNSTTLQTLSAGLFVFSAALITDWHCPIQAATGVACPGCGATRAVMQLGQFNFERAFNYNQLVFIALPLLVLIYLASRKLNKNSQTILIASVAFVIMVTFWIWRALNPPAWL